jgi:hypothetical protein
LNIKFYTASSFKLHFKTLEARGVHIYWSYDFTVCQWLWYICVTHYVSYISVIAAVEIVIFDR